jgi:hypothetical protein
MLDKQKTIIDCQVTECYITRLTYQLPPDTWSNKDPKFKRPWLNYKNQCTLPRKQHSVETSCIQLERETQARSILPEED